MSCMLASSKKNLAMESPVKPDILRGKVALLTGGGSGIGFELSTQFGKHGDSVAIMGRRKNVIRDAVSVLQSLGIPAVGFEGDVRKPEDARRVVEATVEKFGKLDILVNAAAGNFLAAAEDLSPNGFKTERRTREGLVHWWIYTKYQRHFTLHGILAAVDALTRYIALEWGTDYDIRVNGIAPGPIGDTTGMSKLLPKEMNNGGAESMPLYKVGEKWDIAMAAIYLDSVAGKYINGTTLVVDGGLWLSHPHHLPKETVKQLSRTVEKRSRAEPAGIPDSKL